MRYWLQTQAPAGNFYDVQGSNEKQSLINSKKWYDEKGFNAQIVERVDVVIVEASPAEVGSQDKPCRILVEDDWWYYDTYADGHRACVENNWPIEKLKTLTQEG